MLHEVENIFQPGYLYIGGSNIQLHESWTSWSTTHTIDVYQPTIVDKWLWIVNGKLKGLQFYMFPHVSQWISLSNTINILNFIHKYRQPPGFFLSFDLVFPAVFPLSLPPTTWRKPNSLQTSAQSDGVGQNLGCVFFFRVNYPVMLRILGFLAPQVVGKYIIPCSK